MIKTTFKLFTALITVGLFLMPAIGQSQIAYHQDFETIPDDAYFFNFDDSYPALYAQHEGTCDGWAMVANLWKYPNDPGYEAEGVEEIGVSNGNMATVSYSYKIIDRATYNAIPNSFDWGKFTISYSTDPEGDYTIIETVDTTNHIESANCTTRTVSFTPPTGTIYFKISCSLGDRVSKSDLLIMFDDFDVFQSSCAGLPADAATVASRKTACTSDEIELSLNPFYANTGLTYQWQSSINGTTFTNIAGQTNAFSTATQLVTTWYRAQVKCTASGESVFTAPVNVVSSGLPCYCDVLFVATITPITLVDFAGINNTSTNELGYSQKSQDFTLLAAANVLKGKSYPITLEGVSTSNAGDDLQVNDYYSVFIDFNHNGTLDDAGEVFQLGFLDYSKQHIEGTILIPEDALTGKTLMRVFKSIHRYPYTPCSTALINGVGEAEDYIVNIKCIDDIEGNAVQKITEETKGTATVADIDVTVAEGATITWFATEEEALAGTLPLSTDALLVDGATYYAVQTLGECKSEVFAVTINTVLGTPNFTANNFKYYPNPVTNVLNLSYNKNITGVQVYNLLGQQVLAKSINQNEAQLNLATLAVGTYLVKVTANDASTSFKVVKQ